MPERAGDLQALIDAAPAGAVVRLAAGEFHLAEPLVIRRDDVTLAGAGPERTRLVASFAGRGAAVVEVVGAVTPARCLRLRGAVGADGTRLDLDGMAPLPGASVMLTAANDEAFLDGLGAVAWRQAQPELRRTLGTVTAAAGSVAELADPVGFALPAGARLCPLELRRGVTLRGFSVVYDIGGAPDPADYTNARPDHAVDGIRVRGAVVPHLVDLAVIHAGRHPLALDTVLAPRIERIVLRGAWNKGPGGNGYLRLARTVRGRLTDIEATGLRHVVVQWSTHHTVITGLTTDADINLHGGFSHHNRITVHPLAPRPGHPWDTTVTRTPATAAWAPPDGPDNIVSRLGDTDAAVP